MMLRFGRGPKEAHRNYELCETTKMMFSCSVLHYFSQVCLTGQTLENNVNLRAAYVSPLLTGASTTALLFAVLGFRATVEPSQRLTRYKRGGE